MDDACDAAPRPSVRLLGDDRRDAAEFADAVLALLAAARRTRGRLAPLFDDLTVPQLVLLDAVESCGDDGIGAVAAYTGLSQPTVTRGAAGLEAAGLLRRGSDGGDGRRRVLSLTPRGRDLLADKRAVVADQFSAAWDRLDPDERDLAVPLLRHLADLVEHLL
ncbi:MAG TPA: MarR family winged helix-turn-helix transcriptional regulator [Kineosporiaceae bacterium]